jgi:hypothetical protein
MELPEKVVGSLFIPENLIIYIIKMISFKTKKARR